MAVTDTDYSIPLSKISKKKKPFDDSELEFINKFNDDSLILIEDAGDVARDLLHSKLVDMLKLIAQGRDDYEIITMNYYHDDDITINGLESKCEMRFDPIQRNGERCFGLIELNLDGGTSGGHFGGFIKDGKKIWIFDPMSFGPRDDNEGGVYFKIFRQVAMWAFRKEKNIQKVVVAKDKDGCLQLTGGFANTNSDPENYKHDESSEFHLQRYKEYMAHYPSEVVNYMIEYGPDSQNHYCYAWNIYWLHSVFGVEIQGINTFGINPEALSELVESCDLIPVSYIKLYMMQWVEYYKTDLINTVHSVNKGGKFRYQRGYLYNFVKTNLPKTLFWTKIEYKKSDFQDSPYTVATGLIFRNGETIQVEPNGKIPTSCPT